MIDSYSDSKEAEDAEEAKAPKAAFRPQLPIYTPPPAPDPQDEVQRRLEMAQCYQVLLAEPLFEAPTQATEIVETEIKTYIKERMLNLVGLGTPPPTATDALNTSTFTFDETIALKALARSVLARQQQAAPQPTQESSAPVAAPQTPPKAPPAASAKKPSARPTTRKAQAPPSFVAFTGVPATAGTPVAVQLNTKSGPARKKKLSENTYKVRTMDKDGNIHEKDIHPDITPQARPSFVQPAPTPTKLEFETLVNGRAELEAEINAQGFVESFKRNG